MKRKSKEMHDSPELKFDAKQKQVLKLALKSPLLFDEHLKLIANPEFSSGQMRELLRACEELPYDQVLKIANPKISVRAMHEFTLKHRKLKK